MPLAAAATHLGQEDGVLGVAGSDPLQAHQATLQLSAGVLYRHAQEITGLDDSQDVRRAPVCVDTGYRCIHVLGLACFCFQVRPTHT